MSYDPIARSYVPAYIWPQGYAFSDLECYISGERFVFGRCDACDICQCRQNEEILLIPCMEARTCLGCGARTAHGDAIIIATDGACRNNGREDHIPAIGIFFNFDSNNNESFRVTEEYATNQRAELLAAFHALKMAKDMFRKGQINKHITQVVIKTDSAYLVDGITWHIRKWRDNGYLNARGAPIVNRDLMQHLDQICNELVEIGFKPRFWHVPREKNRQADALAKAAINQVNWKGFTWDEWLGGGEMPHIHDV
jgi:ribonuclease HI